MENEEMKTEQLALESKILAELKAPFPDEAYTEDKSRGFALTSVKAQYIPDRLNSVLGITNWNFETETMETTKGILMKGILKIKIGNRDRTVYQYGSSADKNNIADVYKSAMTDALGKCASIIGVGDDVFKGLVKTGAQQAAHGPSDAYSGNSDTYKQPQQNNSSWKKGNATENQKKACLAISKKNGIDTSGIDSLSFDEASKFIKEHGNR